MGGAVAIGDSNKNVAAGFAISGLALGLTGAIVAMIEQPSGPAQLEAEAQRRMFITGQDDPAKVREGVDNINRGQRARCAGGLAQGAE